MSNPGEHPGEHGAGREDARRGARTILRGNAEHPASTESHHGPDAGDGAESGDEHRHGSGGATDEAG